MLYSVNSMSFLKQYDFNKWSGWPTIIFTSIAISFVIFSGVYLFEGLGWLAAYKDEAIDTYKKVGQNWVRGASIAFASSVALFMVSALMLSKNKRSPGRRAPIWNRFDFNDPKRMLGLVCFSVSFTFFVNAAIYRHEYTVWLLSSIASGTRWYLNEAAAWADAAAVMAIIGGLLTASGWFFILVGLKKLKR